MSKRTLTIVINNLTDKDIDLIWRTSAAQVPKELNVEMTPADRIELDHDVLDVVARKPFYEMITLATILKTMEELYYIENAKKE